MGLETGTYISDLVATNPVSADPKSQGDDHIRLIKSTVQATFPNITGAVTPTHTELNYVDGVTSPIQTQLDLKAPLASPNFTGIPTVPTADTGTTGDQVASLDYVIATSLAGTLPGQTGNDDQFLMTDGVNAGWSDTINPAVMKLTGGIDLVGISGVQILEDKSAADFVMVDGGDNTKALAWDTSDITTATTRTVTLVDENVTLFTPAVRYLGKISASNVTTADVEGLFSVDYDDYIIECSNIQHNSTTSSRILSMRIKTDASYLTTGYTTQEEDGDISAGTAQIDLFIFNDTTANTAATRIYLPNIHALKSHCWLIQSTYSATLSSAAAVRGMNSSAKAITGVRFMFASSNITGDFRVYGVMKL